MNDDRTLERAARSFIEVGPTRAPEHAVEAALLRIQSTSQERGPWIPWRFPTMPIPARLVALAVIGGLVLIGVAMMGGVGGRAPTTSTAPSQAVVAAPSAAVASPAPDPTLSTIDYSGMSGRLLVEHLGNALDLSEASSSDYHPDTRRFYFMVPGAMSAKTVTEFLPGQPATGKSAADVAVLQRKVVFQDWADQPRLYEANLDGTGFHKLPVDCSCALLYPDYDPTGSKVVYVRLEGSESWLEILDLATGTTTRLESTVGPRDNAVPEQPAWSPDGTTLAFSRVTWPADADPPVVGTVHYGDKAPTSAVLSLLDIASGAVTDLPTPGLIPGDANWSPDGSTIVFTDGPASTMGSDSAVSSTGIYTIRRDGTALKSLGGWGGPEYVEAAEGLPPMQGPWILYQENVFKLMRSDGADPRPIKSGGMDVSDLAQGFAYVGHWVPGAP